MGTKKNILLIGENPLSVTGNSHMMRAVLSQLNGEKYSVVVFGVNPSDPSLSDPFSPLPFTYVSAEDTNDGWGKQKLLNFLSSRSDIDIVAMIGIDIWRYGPIFKHISDIRKHRKFKWVALFPYDFHFEKLDFMQWIKMLDYPCVYSQYGADIVKKHVPNARYFRPPLFLSELFKPLPQEERIELRKKHFPQIEQSRFIFGFIGRNQLRKDPVKLIRAFMELRRELGINASLYFHSDFEMGVFNLFQAGTDYGAETGDLLRHVGNQKFSTKTMVEIYNAMDCLVNCTMQEGLSWVVLEAMACGTPVIASNGTAHTELLKEGAGILVPMKETSFIPISTPNGDSYIESKSCSVEDIKRALLFAYSSPDVRMEMSKVGFVRSRSWFDGVHDFSSLLDEVIENKGLSISTPKTPEVLFVQHSSAGDVLMSTQCFKGIKERHVGKKLVYMTQSKFRDIVEGNPYIDEIIDWDEERIDGYEIVYNPHGEKILPGGWNNLDVKLYTMYPYFCRVQADDIFIQEVDPQVDLPDEYVVIHNAGGSPYRVYAHMDTVVKILPFKTVQIGAITDPCCASCTLDLRGKLTFRQTAWVMKKAKGAIVIDSYPSHLAGAVATPAVVLYGPAPARVTGPRGNPGKIINLEPNMLEVCAILSHCWGAPPPGKQRCQSPCINSISPMKVKKSLMSLVGGK